MTRCESKILFLHGLDSSRESTKFHAIDAKQKFCIDVDYRYLNFSTVASFYDDIIEKIKPETLYTTNFTEPLSYPGSAFLKLPKSP